MMRPSGIKDTNLFSGLKSLKDFRNNTTDKSPGPAVNHINLTECGKSPAKRKSTAAQIAMDKILPEK